MLGAARAAARAIRRALGPSRLPLTALVHGTIRTRRPMAAAIAIESHLANAKSLPVPTLQAYISALTSSEPQIIPTETAHTPVTAALTVWQPPVARASNSVPHTCTMLPSVRVSFKAKLSLAPFSSSCWSEIGNAPAREMGPSFPTAFTSPIPPDAPIPPFPSPHIMEAIISALDLRPKPNPQTTHDLPPGRPPDSILALAHLTRIFSDRALPFSRYASLLNALARTPPMADKVETYFHGILRQTCHNPPLMDTRSYNVLINYSLSVVRKPGWAERLVEHMSTIRSPPLRITDATRAIITRGEAKLREPGLAARILSHIDARGHSTRLPSNSAPPAPPSTPLYALVDLPKDPHLLAAHIHNLTSLRNSNSSAPASLPNKSPRLFILPLAFHTTIVQLYAREARKGLVVIEPRPSPLAPPHKAKAIVDAGTLLAPTPALAKSSVEGWGYDVQTPGGRTHRGIKRWALARSAAAHVYLTYIRPRLLFPSQIQSQSQSQPQGSTKTGIPSQTDAFVQVLVKDMVAVGMKEDVPGGWATLSPSTTPRSTTRPERPGNCVSYAASSGAERETTCATAGQPRKGTSSGTGSARKGIGQGDQSAEVDEFWNHLSASRTGDEDEGIHEAARAEMQRAMARFERARKSEKLPTKRVRDIWLFVQDKVKELAKIKRMATREGEVRVGGGRYKRRRQVLKPSIGNPSSKVTGILPQSQGKDTLPSPRETTPPSAKIAGLGNVPSARPRSKHRKPRRHS
ncbi:hypothetical protein RHS01_02194 [Rhizoctonia solani]|uniref:Uncharacterized protein n=1 Tax=Rhizoctonia solani TaxID=456999 RepID=A0A8H7IKB1_9AGAM|nr:hypothetical protein RHS01_02194 [Rhizoctonia solani]